MGVVVEVAEAGAADPAVGLVAPVGLQLVGGAQAEAGELLVEVVLVGKEAGQRGVVVAGDGVVVAEQEEAGARCWRAGASMLASSEAMNSCLRATFSGLRSREGT